MQPTLYGKWVRSVYGTYAAALVIVVGLNLSWMLGSPNLFASIGAAFLPRGLALIGAGVVVSLPLLIYAATIGLPRRRKLRRIADDREALRCPWCLYDLAGAPEVGACPECGAQYTLDGVRRYWPEIRRNLILAKRTGFPLKDRRLLEDCGWK